MGDAADDLIEAGIDQEIEERQYYQQQQQRGQMTKKQTTELVVVGESQFPMLASDARERVAMLLQTVTRFELLPIQTPSGGGQLWQFEGLGGTIKGVQTFDAIVCVVKGKQKKFWEHSLDDDEGERGPPQCVSVDSINGYGNPGGECIACPHNAWESADRGKGKKCQDHALMYLFREGGRMPYVLTVPATSLKAMGRYMMSVANEGYNQYQVVTRFALQPATSATGFEYSKILFSIAALVEGEEALANAKAMHDELKRFAGMEDIKAATASH